VVDGAGDGAAFCLKSGVYRMQVARPRSGQRFYGEAHTVLNGSRLITTFKREGRFWVAGDQRQHGRKHGQCLLDAPACSLPEAVFVDDNPLIQVLNKESVGPNQFYFDYVGERIYLADDPTGRKVEATVAAFAFESTASDVLISNITVEKYASVAQKGAIHAGEGTRWAIENCEVRLNSGEGIGVGTGSRVRNCYIHHNGQIGIAGTGQDIVIEENSIVANNIHGFDPAWQAGGAKIASGDGVTFRGNHVDDNRGPGLWCDIGCRNVLYENNLIENNRDAGIFHEISFRAVIRNNDLRHNSRGDKTWFWGADIIVAASQDVDIRDNTLAVTAGRCGVVLIDQGRPSGHGEEYQTRNNIVHHNEMRFEGAACAGGVSDTRPDDKNFAIITDGNNRFDNNLYLTSRNSGPAYFVWGHDITDWDGFRRKGLEQSGQMVLF